MALSWNQVGSLKGPQDQRGETGTSVTVKGAVSDKSKLPADAAIGDTYVTSDDGHMWVKTSMSGGSQWTDLGAMKGPKGDTGPAGPTGPQGPKGVTGPKGADGTSVTAGTGAPSGTAAVGSVYIDASTGNLYTYKA